MRAKDLLGKSGEQAAADYLTSCGLRILDRNWRSADGEICPGDQFQHRGEFSRVLEFCRPPPQERVCLGVAARDNRIAK